MPRCTCNNCVCCAGVLNGTHVWWAMLSVWHGHLLWDHQTRTPHSLVGPTFLLGFWDCGSLAYSAPNIGFEIFFPNFFIPNWALWGLLFGPVGPTESNGWEWSSSREILECFLSVSHTRSWHICPWVGLYFGTFVYGNKILCFFHMYPRGLGKTQLLATMFFLFRLSMQMFSCFIFSNTFFLKLS